MKMEASARGDNSVAKVSRNTGGASVGWQKGRNTTEILKALIAAGVGGPALGALAQYPMPRFGRGSRSNTLSEQAVRSMGQSRMTPEDLLPRQSRVGASSRGGSGLGGGSRLDMLRQKQSLPKPQVQQRQDSRNQRAEMEKERRARMRFDAQLAAQFENQRLQQLMGLIGGLPKQRRKTSQQLVNIAGSYVPKTVSSTEDIDYTSLLARFL